MTQRLEYRGPGGTIWVEVFWDADRILYPPFELTFQDLQEGGAVTFLYQGPHRHQVDRRVVRETAPAEHDVIDVDEIVVEPDDIKELPRG